MFADCQEEPQTMPSDQQTKAEAEGLQEYNMDVNAPPSQPVYLKREKESPPCLNAPKHPHGTQPPSAVHPSTGQARPMTYGNDNSSVNRQSRVQSSRPDPIPGKYQFFWQFEKL